MTGKILSILVKENEPGLKEQIEKVFKIQSSEIIDIEEDLGHGRIEKRTCEVITKLDFLDDGENWTNLKSIIKITSERTIKKTNLHSSETRFYIRVCLKELHKKTFSCFPSKEKDEKSLE